MPTNVCKWRALKTRSRGCSSLLQQLIFPQPEHSPELTPTHHWIDSVQWLMGKFHSKYQHTFLLENLFKNSWAVLTTLCNPESLADMISYFYLFFIHIPDEGKKEHLSAEDLSTYESTGYSRRGPHKMHGRWPTSSDNIHVRISWSSFGPSPERKLGQFICLIFLSCKVPRLLVSVDTMAGVILIINNHHNIHFPITQMPTFFPPPLTMRTSLSQFSFPLHFCRIHKSWSMNPLAAMIWKINIISRVTLKSWA